MINRYYQQELANLRDLGLEFARAHPALAPMLGGVSADPDVERLLEGLAFLSGLLRQKLDDEFPEIIQGLTQLIFPHYLRPIPSTAVVAFTPKPNLMQSMKVAAGVELASIPVQDTQAYFKTCYDVEVHPLKLLEAKFEQPPGQPPAITLLLELAGIELPDWKPTRLRLHFTKDYAIAANLYSLLSSHLRNIVIESAGGAPATLGPNDLKPVGFADNEALIPYPSNSFPGYRILQEYFILPEKFLFLDLTGFEKWQKRGAGPRFKISFVLSKLPFPPPKIDKDNIVLFATPVINIFSKEAEPITLDHRQPEYRVEPSGTNRQHFQVYSVDKVVGFQRGQVKPRDYTPFELFRSPSSNAPIYHVSYRKSPIRNAIDALLSFTYPPESGAPSPETLSIQLSCTNADLPENLKSGDICRPTGSSPDLLDYKNIRPPTTSILPPLGRELLWRLLSLYSLNYLPLARTDNIKALLRLYIFPDSKDQTGVYANQRRVDGVTGIEVKNADRLVAGYMMRGQEIRLKLLSDHFASEGDIFLFGSVLDRFLGSYASINSFTQLVVLEELKQEIFKWPTRLGDRPLL